jgi:beta-1,4-N-acetylglucosaminyltransferase
MRSRNKYLKVCLVSSSGGHLVKLLMLKEWWEDYERFWVVRDDILTQEALGGEKKYFGYFPENRNWRNLLRNLYLAVIILRKERPNLVFSIGAGIGPPFIWIAKLMGIQTVFMETFIFIPKPTLSGRLTYGIADYFLVQNKELLKVYPKANYWGSAI